MFAEQTDEGMDLGVVCTLVLAGHNFFLCVFWTCSIRIGKYPLIVNNFWKEAVGHYCSCHLQGLLA